MIINLPYLPDLVITPWKIIGYTGAFLFASRWFVQVIASRNSKKPVVPRLFWYLSISGSLLILAYFIFGK
ncbi:MAG: lipid-A-disaccharide synthase N-terminal domain-containing protein, partial [bacterium]